MPKSDSDDHTMIIGLQCYVVRKQPYELFMGESFTGFTSLQNKQPQDCGRSLDILISKVKFKRKTINDCSCKFETCKLFLEAAVKFTKSPVLVMDGLFQVCDLPV